MVRRTVLFVTIATLTACASLSPPSERPAGPTVRLTTVTLAISGMT